MKHEMFTDYRTNDATDIFAFAYTDKSTPKPSDTVYTSFVPADSAELYLNVDRKSSSHGGGHVLRFKPTVSQKCDMRNTYGVIALATFETVNNTLATLKELANADELPCKSNALNRGHSIEYLLCERWGIEWTFDNASHALQGDITRDGVEYQVKFQGASL